MDRLVGDGGDSNPNPNPKCRHLVAVPYPGRGHVNPMMNLCNQLLSSSNSKGLLSLLISFVVTEEWLGLIIDHYYCYYNNNIRFLTIPNVIPSEHVRGADFPGFIEAVYTKMELPFDLLLDRLHPPATSILADSYLPWAVAVANRRSIPVASLWTMSPSIFQLFLSNPLDHFSTERGEEAIVAHIPGIKSMGLDDLRPFCYNKSLLSRALEASRMASKAQCLVLTSFYELERLVTDTLRAQFPVPVYTLGPSIPYTSLDHDHDHCIKGGSADHHYLSWLHSQPQNSVLYVSLGSFLSVSDAQMDEIAAGLRDCGVRFLWVVRGNASSRMQELSGEMGLVVPWCHQLRVLSHSSVGGFLTHCGLNSTLESIYAGVPMLTFPIAWDQFHDSKLIVDDLEVGLSLKAKRSMLGPGVEGVVVRGEEIALSVQRLMDLDGDESKELRRRATQLQETCQGALDEGGSSYANLDAFVTEFVCSPQH